MAKTQGQKTPELTEDEELFILAYYDQASPTFGNGTQSIITARGEQYFTNSKGLINYNLAGVKAYEWLRLHKITSKGRDILNKQGFNDDSVDTQHSFVINQSADMSTKLRAIDIYNKLQGRYEKDNKQKQDFTLNIGWKMPDERTD